MTLQELYESWSSQTPDNAKVLQKFDTMAVHFPVPPGENLNEKQRKEYFTDTFFLDYVLPYVKAVETQAFLAAYKQAFRLFTELTEE